jgi:diacylglycerol kinase
MLRTIKSFKYAWNGLKTVWNEESNFRVEVFVGLLVVVASIYFNFNFYEVSLVIFAVTIVLVSEIINTIVEDLCNKIELLQDPIIGKIKDMSAAFVLVGSIGALIIGLLVFYNHFV